MATTAVFDEDFQQSPVFGMLKQFVRALDDASLPTHECIAVVHVVERSVANFRLKKESADVIPFARSVEHLNIFEYLLQQAEHGAVPALQDTVLTCFSRQIIPALIELGPSGLDCIKTRLVALVKAMTMAMAGSEASCTDATNVVLAVLASGELCDQFLEERHLEAILQCLLFPGSSISLQYKLMGIIQADWPHVVENGECCELLLPFVTQVAFLNQYPLSNAVRNCLADLPRDVKRKDAIISALLNQCIFHHLVESLLADGWFLWDPLAIATEMAFHPDAPADYPSQLFLPMLTTWIDSSGTHATPDFLQLLDRRPKEFLQVREHKKR